MCHSRNVLKESPLKRIQKSLIKNKQSMRLWDSGSENKESELKSKLTSKTQILRMIINVLNTMLTVAERLTRLKSFKRIKPLRKSTVGQNKAVTNVSDYYWLNKNIVTVLIRSFSSLAAQHFSG